MATPESNPLDAASPLESSQPLAVAAGSAVCGKCGQPMRYNVPRIGPDGGYVHAASGGPDCFATVTPEQLDADLNASHFDEYNKIGAPIILPLNTEVTR